MTKVNKKKEVRLTQDKLKQILNYNEETGEFVWAINPNLRTRKISVGQSAGSITGNGYLRIGVGGYYYLAHRLAWLYVYGDFPNNEKSKIDHIDGDKSNNRINNLRSVSNTENNRNRRKGSTNSSGENGVCRFKIPVKRGAKAYMYWCWRASWYNECGVRRVKHFNIATYGEEQAKEMAIAHRKEQIRLLKVNHNINYSERHGN